MQKKLRNILKAKNCVDANEEQLVGSKASGCPEGICICLSPRTCHFRSCILDRRRGCSRWSVKTETPPCNIRTHEVCTSMREGKWPSLRRKQWGKLKSWPWLQKSRERVRFVKMCQHKSAYVGLEFKITLVSGLRNVSQEVDLKGQQICKISHALCWTSSFWKKKKKVL